MNLNKKVDISKALTMSLDDYARESGMYISSYLKQPKLTNGCQNTSKFDRIDDDNDINQDDDDEEALLEINTNDDDNFTKKDIKIEETDITENSTFDLRNLINGNNDNSISKLPKANSLQWRLMHPNNTHNRPAGMPPLIQNDADFDLYNINPRQNIAQDNYAANCDNLYHNNNNNNNNKGNQNNNNNVNRNNRNRNYNRNKPYNNKNNNYNRRRNNFNNNKRGNQMNHNNIKSNEPQKNVYFSNNQGAYQHYQNNNQLCRMIDGTVPNDITIQINPLMSSSTINSNNISTKPVPLMSLPQTPPMFLNSISDHTNNLNISENCLNNNVNVNNNNTAIQPYGNTVNLELTQLSSIASTLLDTLRNGVVPEDNQKKYDMKLQKEIHSIQRKPMIYKCPNGEVISSDGPGLDLGMKPSTTGISLNQRFA